MTVPEEVALKWYEMIQTQLPMTTLASLFGPLPLSLRDQRFLLSAQVPWALACARGSHFFMNIYFERELERDIGEMRRQYKISVAPSSGDNIET